MAPTYRQGADLQAGQGWQMSGQNGVAPGPVGSAPALANRCPAPEDASAAQPHFWTLHLRTPSYPFGDQKPLG